MRNAQPYYWLFCPARRLCLAAVVLMAALLALAAQGNAAPQFPELTGQIVDNAGLLSAEDRAAVLSDLKALEGKATDQFTVVTVPSLDGYEIEDYGYQLGRKWGIGQAGKNNGILLIVAPKERKVRIEVGRGLEPVMTDLLSSLIIQNAILPAFRRGDFSGGIKAGARDIKDVLLGDAEAVKERAKVGKAEGPDWLMILIILFWLSIVAFVIYAQMQQAQQAPQSAGRRRGRTRNRSIFTDPTVGSGTWGGGGGGGWSSGDSGGGGWSGGGGDFGGGGSSGSW